MINPLQNDRNNRMHPVAVLEVSLEVIMRASPECPLVLAINSWITRQGRYRFQRLSVSR